MQQRLPDDWTNTLISRRRPRGNDLIAQLTTKPALHARTLTPPANLPSVIAASSSRVESTVPLEPAVRVRVGNPTGTFPHAQAASAFDAEFVDRRAVFRGG